MPPRSELGAVAAALARTRAGGGWAMLCSEAGVPMKYHFLYPETAQRGVLGCVFVVFNKGVQQASARFCLPTGAKCLVSLSLCKGAARLPAWVAACFTGLESPVFVTFYNPDKLLSPVFQAQDLYCTSMGIIIRQNDLRG